jgi:hypothetical protein
MKKIYFLFFTFLSLFSKVLFIIDNAINTIKSTNLYVYSLLNIQNNNIKNSIYLNNKNNLYSNNSITFNGNVLIEKLPSLNIGNYFLVLDENNNLGIYDALMLPKNKILKEIYNSITTNIIMSIDDNELLIQNDINNITINGTDKVTFNGNEIFINDTISSKNNEVNIYNLDKTDIISIPFDIDSDNIEYKGSKLTISEIEMKNFFSYNNVINIFTNILFEKKTKFDSSGNNGNITFLSNPGQITLSKNLILANINSSNIKDNITCLTIDNNYIKKSTLSLKKNIILLPLNTDILIGNDKAQTCSIIFKNKNPLDTKLTINNIIIDDCWFLSKGFGHINNFYKNNFFNTYNIETHINNFDLNNFFNNAGINECHIEGHGRININSITNFDTIVFNGKVILDANNNINVKTLSTANYSDSVKQLVMVNQDGLLGYINNSNDNRYDTMEIQDAVLYDNLIALYILHYNEITLNNDIEPKNNFVKNNIIKSIKNIFNTKQNSELFNKLFQYDEEKDLLYYNAIFAEELLEKKKNALNQYLATPKDKINHKKIKKIQQEVDNSLKEIKNSIEEILSIDTPKTGKII